MCSFSEDEIMNFDFEEEQQVLVQIKLNHHKVLINQFISNYIINLIFIVKHYLFSISNAFAYHAIANSF